MSKNVKIIIIVGLVAAVAALSIGYAALSQTLNITGTAQVTGNTWSVAMQTATCTKTGGASFTTPTTNATDVTLSGIVLKLPGDSVTCTIPVKNTGTIAAKLTAFTKKTVNYAGAEADKTIVTGNTTYTVTYDGSATPTINSTLAVNTTKNVVIKIEYNGGATTVPADSVTINNLGATLVFGQA